MAAEFDMTNAQFLTYSRKSETLSSDKRSKTIIWDCYPGSVYYYYVIPGGSTQRQGCYTAEGICRYSGGSYKAAPYRCCFETKTSTTPSLGEGVKCVKIQYRKNGGSWVTYQENSSGLAKANCQFGVTSYKNGDYYEVKCTYQVWTQGSPFRDVPFMWFGDSKGYYNSGANQFKQGTPTPPARGWSGMQNWTSANNAGTDRNANWSIKTTTWYRPNSTSLSTNWTYLHAQYYGNSAWNSTYLTEFYKSGMNNGSDMGWTGNVTGRNPQTCRKSLWWTFERTYTDTYTVSGISELPDALSNPVVTIRTIDNLTNVDSNNRYDGTHGTVSITYKHAQKRTGYVKLIGVSTDANGNTITKQVLADTAMNSDSTKNVVVDFGNSGFTRSRSIAYYAVAYVIDTDYNNTYRYAQSSGTSFSECTANGKHYYNSQPPVPASTQVIDTGDRTEKIAFKWSASIDPDGHPVTYRIFLKRGDSSLNYYSEYIYINGVKQLISYHYTYTTTSTSSELGTSSYGVGEKVTIYISPRDPYHDTQFSAAVLGGSIDTDVAVSLNVINNMNNRDSSGVFSGDHGTVTCTYSNKSGRKGRIQIYAYRATKDYYQADYGEYFKKVYDSNSCNVSPGSTITVDIDFEKEGYTRGRYYKYFAKATDSNNASSPQPYDSITNSNMWKNGAVGEHYFNSVPSAVTPFIAEEGTTNDQIFLDDKVLLGWGESVDLEYSTIYYKMYIQIPGLAGNKTETFYSSLTDSGVTREYTEAIELGKNIVRNKTNPYTLICKEAWAGQEMNIWIKTYDMYNAKKYLTGSVLKLFNTAVNPEVPDIDIDYVYETDFYGRDKQNGEAGYVRVNHTHQLGNPATVKLHALVKKLDTNEITVFKDITSWNISSGSWSPKTKLNFATIFGEELRGSEIRYYATALTDTGRSSVPDGWTPNASMWSSWVPGHKFNEEPSGAVLVFNDDLSNLHYSAVFDWTPAVDPDDNLYPVSYAVVFSVKSQPRYEMTFFHGPNKDKDLIKTYTQIWDTTNTRIEIDLDGYDEGEEFEVWVVPHDDYTNSYYYTTNAYTFKKATFGKPKIETTLSQVESEYGILKVKYSHEDVEYIDGQYISKDPDKNVEDFTGLISVYCYIEDRFCANYIIENEQIKIGQELTFDIPFEEVSPLSRSVEIRYVVIAEDSESHVRNTNISPSKAEVHDFIVGAHYYNDEPENPEVCVGALKDYVSEEDYEKDKFVYGFNYAFLCWDQPFEPDADRCVYYAYLKTPDSFEEPVLKTIINRRDDMGNIEPVSIDYNRKYKIVEKYDKDNRLYGSDVYYYTDVANNKISLIQQDNPFIGLQIDYQKDHLGKEWPLIRKRDAEKEEFINEHCNLYVEARDVRTLTNSYYGLSDMFDTYRMEHEPPNDVQLQVIPNLSDGIGDGERGKIKVLYTHPEGDINGTVDIYAFQNDENGNFIFKGKVFTIDNICNGIEQTVEIDFLSNENNHFNVEHYRLLDRSKRITYFAIATDHLVGMTSYDKYNEIGLQMKYVPYLIPDENGLLNYYMLNINGVAYDYNIDGHYSGPVLSGEHYFNEEPPSTTPEEVNEDNISFISAEIKWPHVKDPDGDAVQYELYISSSDEYMNSNEAVFYNDYLDKLSEDDTVYTPREESMDIEPIFFSEVMAANGIMRYHKKVNIPASLAEASSLGLSVATSEYSEDSIINMWLVSKDSYTNSYYRAGNILTLLKGHHARDVRSVYPRNGSTVYATQPRILINLAEDNQRQTVYVQWKDQTYNNKDHKEYFSSYPGVKEAVVFKPPVPYTTLHGMKVTYAVWVHNQCSYSNKTYVTYTYKDFFNDLTENRLIALKSNHINLFRKAINITRDAYGLETVKFTREIQKNMIFENFDFNETKYAICAVNDLLNSADDTQDLDYVNKLIVDLKDLDLVDYEGDVEAGSYNEFLEWARLLYILENL